MTWQAIRIQTLERDSYQCQHCGKKDKLEIHHLIPRRKGGLDVLENTLTVCRKCHKTIEPCRKMGYPNKVTWGKNIAVSAETHGNILMCGKMGDSIGDVITRIVNYYIDKELKGKL
jgi:hypothetical protein